MGPRFRKRRGKRLPQKVVLRREVSIEAAMSEAGIGHKAGDSRPLDPVPAKPARRGLDERPRRLPPCALLVPRRLRSELALYMTVTILYVNHHLKEVQMTHDPVCIVLAARTPLGRFQGELAGIPAPALGSHAVRAALDRAGLAPDRADEALMGCVLLAGQDRRPPGRRPAGRSAGCHRRDHGQQGLRIGMKATMLAHGLILAGSAGIVVAGGMESMSNAPYLLSKARSGYRVGMIASSTT